MIYAATRSQPGHQNQDAFFLGHSPFSLAALFDGAGHAEGCAKRAAQQLHRFHSELNTSFVTFETWKTWVHSLDNMLSGHESTMVAVTMNDNRLMGVCVGDSRAYLIREGKTIFLTEGSGKNRLGSGSADPKPIFHDLELHDVVLLLSDGAWTKFTLDSIARLVMKNLLLRPADLASVVIEDAARRGVDDDMTAVVMIR